VDTPSRFPFRIAVTLGREILATRQRAVRHPEPTDFQLDPRDELHLDLEGGSFGVRDL